MKKAIIKLTENPNNVAIFHFDDLFTTSLPWAEFRLNSDLLGNNASMINFDKIHLDMEGFPITFIYPKTVIANGTEMSVFDYLYEDLKQHEISTKEFKYKVTNDEDLFAIQIEIHIAYESFFGGRIEIDEEATITYNKEWGVLSMYELDFRTETFSGVEKAEILLEITDEDLKVEVAYGWFTSISVLIIAGLVILRKRKKLSK